MLTNAISGIHGALTVWTFPASFTARAQRLLYVGLLSPELFTIPADEQAMLMTNPFSRLKEK